jgi:hypothetical protein
MRVDGATSCARGHHAHRAWQEGFGKLWVLTFKTGAYVL